MVLEMRERESGSSASRKPEDGGIETFTEGWIRGTETADPSWRALQHSILTREMGAGTAQLQPFSQLGHRETVGWYRKIARGVCSLLKWHGPGVKQLPAPLRSYSWAKAGANRLISERIKGLVAERC